MLKYILKLFTQKQCLGCKKSGHFFCPDCGQSIDTYKPFCYVCKKPSAGFCVHDSCQKDFCVKQVIVLTRYRQARVQRLLKHAKYYKKYSAYGDIVFQNRSFFRTHILLKDSIFVPVPMNFLRKWKRGYNQSEKIAEYLSKICNIPVDNKCIIRSKYTKQQSKLGASDRKSNLRNAFLLKKENFIDKDSVIYIVDDVISTGSTVHEIAKLLNKNGYKNIRAIVLASD